MSDTLAAAIDDADTNATLLDDRMDLEDHAIYVWLRAHQIHKNAYHRLVIGSQPLPAAWRAKTLRFSSEETAGTFLRRFVHDPVALHVLRTLGHGLSTYRAPSTDAQLMKLIATALYARTVWAMEAQKPPVSRFVGKTSPAVFAALNPKYGTKVDFAYIANLEGNQWLRGYVPMRKGVVIGRSGMTVASGFDIGQWSGRQLEAFGFPPALMQKISPFAGHAFKDMNKAAVVAAVAKLGPVPELSKSEADLCDGAVFGAILETAIADWDRGRSAGTPAFRAMPGAWQTVWLSRNYQEGRKPKMAQAKAFRAAALAGRWADAIAQLNQYPNYRDRAQAEAALLSSALPPAPVKPAPVAPPSDLRIP